MQSTETHDGRSFVRINNEMTIQYRVLPERVNQTSGEAETKNVNKTQNVSVRGICFQSSSELPVDEQVVIELRLPDHETPITPIARVAWCRPSGETYDTGLELMWLDWQADEQLIFANYIHDVCGDEIDRI